MSILLIERPKWGSLWWFVGLLVWSLHQNLLLFLLCHVKLISQAITIIDASECLSYNWLRSATFCSIGPPVRQHRDCSGNNYNLVCGCITQPFLANNQSAPQDKLGYFWALAWSNQVRITSPVSIFFFAFFFFFTVCNIHDVLLKLPHH